MRGYGKDFEQWYRRKKEIDARVLDKEIKLRPGEVRWAALGVNIGSEIDGKGKEFLRPVLIIAVRGISLALVAPLTSAASKIPGYVPLHINGRKGSLCVHQMRVISQKRIGDRIEKISRRRLRPYKEKVKEFFHL